MKNKAVRIILDTNLWISFLISKDFSKLDELLFTKQCTLVFSQELLEEFISVAERPKFRRFFSSTDMEAILETIDQFADFIRVESKIDICRDSKDNFLLSLAVDGQADYLITGDSDLLDLRQVGSTTILPITEFLKKN
ncbi:MAG: putative toxin-antitoxin system toxin component, PIN family [Sphingobacteriaceae bacterium]|nr:putative toxin-antitoxin system toxin component, PIN family [Sphingobacteriaceae bacterium]